MSQSPCSPVPSSPSGPLLLRLPTLPQQCLDALPQVAWITDAEGHLLTCNRQWHCVTGQPREIELWAWVHAEDRDRLQHAYSAQPQTIEYRLAHRDGAFRWMQAQITPLWDTEGQLQGHLTLSSRSDRPDRSAALQTDFCSLVNGLPDAILWEADPQTLAFTFVSDSATTLLGYPAHQWLRDDCFWLTLVHSEDRGWVKHFRQEEIAQGKDFRCEYRCVSASGQTLWLREQGYLVRAEDGTVQKLRGILINVTRTKHAEDALRSHANELARTTRALAQTSISLEQRNRDLDQFAYIASHDLKAPLRAIANLSQWLEEDLDGVLTPDTRHQMTLMRGRVRRLEGLIDGLLQYSRVGRLPSDLEPVSVADLVHEILDSLAPPPEFQVRLHEPLPTFWTARLPLAQVLTNLISNAIKHHGRDRGTIAISAQDLGTYYEFSVADDGVGIAPRYHEKIFMIFQTLAARDRVDNTGIGLAIVKKIIDGYGGHITVQSDLNQGAIFRFSWPKSLSRQDTRQEELSKIEIPSSGE